MRRRGKAWKLSALVTLGVAATIVLGGCDWPMIGYDAALTGSSPDNNINTVNASTLQPLFTSFGAFASPVEVNGIVYVVRPNPLVGTSDGLEAFDANGVTNCSGTPNQCTPLWTAPVPTALFGAPAVANGVVYVTASGNALEAFDANGVTNCSGTPKVCQPLWTSSDAGHANFVPDSFVVSPIVANGVVYVPASTGIAAFDANGVTNCSGAPKVCQPLWTTATTATLDTPAVANGVLYVAGYGTGGGFFAYSAAGTTNCSGTPLVCSPLWSASPGGATMPVVSGGVVYLESGGNLDAFDANGVTNCSGLPTTCAPLWTAALPDSNCCPLGIPNSPAVANGIVYAGQDGLQAFDATGVTNCSGTPKVCTALWSYNNARAFGDSSPSVANGLVFYPEAPPTGGGPLAAYDANGVTNCSGTPKVCQPVWTASTGGGLVTLGSAAIANGKVYAADNEIVTTSGGDLDAWVLPPPTSTILIPSDNATVSGSTVFAAGASSGVSNVYYELTGGTMNHQIIAKADPTIYGWLARWDSTTVPNGVYSLQTIASYGADVNGTSAPVTITVSN